LDPNGRQRLQGVPRISSVSEAKVSENVALLNGQANDIDMTRNLDVLSLTSLTIANNAVAEKVEDCLNGKREVEMAEIHNNQIQKPGEECQNTTAKNVSFEDVDNEVK
jgi:hypothetical protein